MVCATFAKVVVGAVVDQRLRFLGSSLPVIGKGMLEAAIKQRRHKPMFIVDIAVPRDVEPEAAELSDIYLYTLDDLTEIIEENVKQRRQAAEEAETLVDDGANYYLRLLRF